MASHASSPFFQLLHKIAPGLVALLHYNRSWLRGDLAAGLSVAAVALPVGIAYADLAGVPAVVGMYSAIFPLFAYAIFGSSKQLMTGPDAATCIMVATSLTPLAAGDPTRYMALVVLMSFCTGILYLIAGFARIGFIANFLSLPTLSGFLNGLALIIIGGQLKKIFGITLESGDFFPQLLELAQRLNETHLPTLILGISLLVVLIMLRRICPRVPSALVVMILGIIAVSLLNLDQKGVAILGVVPAGMPDRVPLAFPGLDHFKDILRDSTALVLVSFTSGILTAKSFAQRNHYNVDANRELFGFGMCNIASGLAQGFPVTGADSRTAVNDAMGGKSQLVGIVAGCTMLVILFFLTTPLGEVPNAALAAVIIIAAAGLFDFATLKELYAASRLEFAMSATTAISVLVLGVLPGVMLAVLLSIIMLLAIYAKPKDAILGKVHGFKGYHSCADHPEAKTKPGLLIYRFEANIVFFNADYFVDRLMQAISLADSPIEWVIVDASPINLIDITALRKIEQLKKECDLRNISLVVCGEKRNIGRFFDSNWMTNRNEAAKKHEYATLKSAVHAFNRRNKKKHNQVPH